MIVSVDGTGSKGIEGSVLRGGSALEARLYFWGCGLMWRTGMSQLMKATATVRKMGRSQSNKGQSEAEWRKKDTDCNTHAGGEAQLKGKGREGVCG